MRLQIPHEHELRVRWLLRVSDASARGEFQVVLLQLGVQQLLLCQRQSLTRPRLLELPLQEVGADRLLLQLQRRDLRLSELNVVRLLSLDQWLLNWSDVRLLQHGLLLRFLQLLLFHLFFFNRPEAQLS